MKNVPFLALLMVGCTTSSAPVDGTDVGPRLDGTSFDAPSFDVASPIDTGGPDIMAPLFDSGIRPDAGPRDAGPPEPDVGPPDLDAGRPDTGPPDGGFCVPDGSYEATPDPSNPPVCSAANINRCRVGTAAASIRISCGSINTACDLDAEDCTCSGTTEFAGVTIDVLADFDNGLISFSSMGQSCNFTLTPR